MKVKMIKLTLAPLNDEDADPEYIYFNPGHITALDTEKEWDKPKVKRGRVNTISGGLFIVKELPEEILEMIT